MTRLEQKEKRKIDILYKGLELFVKKGYKATKITDIASELNMSVGLLFHYFKSKEELYYELVRLGVDGTNNIKIDINIDSLTFLNNYVSSIFKTILLFLLHLSHSNVIILLHLQTFQNDLLFLYALIYMGI